MGAQIKRICSLAIAGILVMTQGTITEASTISTSVEGATSTVGEESVKDPPVGGENLVDSETTEEVTLTVMPEITDTGPYDTGPNEEEPAEEYKVTTNEDGQTVYHLLSDVSECLKIDMTEGETVYIEGNGHTVQTDDNGIYASGNGTLVISDVTVLGGDNTSGVGVLDGDVNITLRGDVSIQELYFGGNKLTVDDNANVTLYGRGSQVQSFYYVGKEFSKGENASLVLVQTGMEDYSDSGQFRHVYIAYGDGIGNVEYVTDQDTIAASVVLPILAAEGNSFKGWYYDGSFDKPYDTAEAITDGMVIYTKFTDSRGKVQKFTDTEVEEIAADAVASTVSDKSDTTETGTKETIETVSVENPDTEQPGDPREESSSSGNHDTGQPGDPDAESQDNDLPEEGMDRDLEGQISDETSAADEQTPLDEEIAEDKPDVTDTGQPPDESVISDMGQSQDIDDGYTTYMEDDTGPGIAEGYSALFEDDTGPGITDQNEQAIMIEDNTGPQYYMETDRTDAYNTGPGDTT
jgi:hypothetical protein